MHKQNRAIIVAQSDEHGGANLGLMSPKTKLVGKDKKSYSPQLTETQEYF